MPIERKATLLDELV